MKKITFTISVFLVLGILIIVGLLIFSRIKHEKLSYSNGFKRNIKKTILRQSTIKLQEKPFQIIDAVEDTVLIGVFPPQYYLLWDRNTNCITKFRMPILVDQKLTSNFSFAKSNSSIHIFGGNIHSLINYDLSTQSVSVDSIPLNFNNSTLISSKCFIARGFAEDVSNPIFMKVTLSPLQIMHENNVSEHRNDGGISNWGTLKYDKDSKRIFYIHSFENTIVCMDTNLNLIFRGHTIDTNFSCKMRTGNNTSNIKGFTLLTPPVKINKCFAINRGFIYVLSAIKSDNESLDEFRKNHVVDVYEVETGRYLESFHVPKSESNVVKDICVSDKEIIFLESNSISIFEL